MNLFKYTRINKIFCLYDKGYSIVEISRKISTSQATVRYWLGLTKKRQTARNNCSPYYKMAWDIKHNIARIILEEVSHNTNPIEWAKQKRKDFKELTTFYPENV